jgi:two-component system, NarL family, sensor histidine kinase DesK
MSPGVRLNLKACDCDRAQLLRPFRLSQSLRLTIALSARSGLLAIGVATLVALATLVAIRPALSPELQDQFPVLLASDTLQALLLGLGAVAVNNLITTEGALRTARQELDRLAVEQERLRFARDMHDLLGHSLSLIVFKSELAGRLLPDLPQPALAEVSDIESVARAALGEVREAVAGYRQPTLAAELAGAQAALATAGIECRVEDGIGPLSPEGEAVCAWTVREGATNVIRHSHARHCCIRLSSADGTGFVEFTDDGRGDSEPEMAAGSGLLGLRERVAARGGRLEAGPLPSGGFRLRVMVPLMGSGRAPIRRGGRAVEAE